VSAVRGSQVDDVTRRYRRGSAVAVYAESALVVDVAGDPDDLTIAGEDRAYRHAEGQAAGAVVGDQFRVGTAGATPCGDAAAQLAQ
jgi:hypothetical protein